MLAPVFRHTPILEFFLIEHHFWFPQSFYHPPCGSNFMSAKFPISLEYNSHTQAAARVTLECLERIERSIALLPVHSFGS